MKSCARAEFRRRAAGAGSARLPLDEAVGGARDAARATPEEVFGALQALGLDGRDDVDEDAFVDVVVLALARADERRAGRHAGGRDAAEEVDVWRPPPRPLGRDATSKERWHAVAWGAVPPGPKHADGGFWERTLRDAGGPPLRCGRDDASTPAEVAGDGAPAAAAEVAGDGAPAALERDGYARLQSVGRSAELDQLAAAARALRRAGLPPAFLWMYDATWDAVAAAHARVAALLVGGGDGATLEPSVFCWALEPGGGAAGPGTASFGLPHRDFTYGEAHDQAGAPRVLTSWLPLSDCSTEAGGIMVVPKGADDAFEACGGAAAPTDAGADPSPDALRGSGVRVAFPLGAVRALYPRAGEPLCWEGNLIHWATACSETCAEPRVSLGWTVRRAGEAPIAAPFPPVDAAALRDRPPVAARLRLVAWALCIYSKWYDLDAAPWPEQLAGLAARGPGQT